MDKVTCLNCGGQVKPLEDAKGNVGACERCGQAELTTKAKADENEKAIAAGVPSGGSAPALTEEDFERAASAVRPDLTDTEGAPVPDLAPEVLSGASEGTGDTPA